MNTLAQSDPLHLGYRQYDHSDFQCFKRSEGKKQHNIMWLVGNGFDISALEELNSPHRTDYQSFFYYLKSTTLKLKESNFLYEKMDELRVEDELARKEGKEKSRVPNWSDFEALLQNFTSQTDGKSISKEHLDADLKEIQRHFSKFLENVVSPEILNRLDEKAAENQWAYRSFSRFLADLDPDSYKALKFPTVCKHYDVFNFNIVNFNYTALLENYLYLDKVQFNPTPHATTDTNFQFRRNPRDYPGGGANANTGCSSYLMTEVHHPHGVQQIPRSLLFGIDGDDRSARRASAAQLEKPFWAQTPRRYQKLIQETELFIIFGSSRGSTDKWWWRHIIRSILKGAELIIYEYSPNDTSQQKQHQVARTFISDNFDSALCEAGFNQEVADLLSNRISVVLYRDSSSISGLGFSTNPFTPNDRDPNNIAPVV